MLILGANLTFDAFPGENSGRNIILQDDILLELFFYEEEVLCCRGMGSGKTLKVLVKVLQVLTRSVRDGLGSNKDLHYLSQLREMT